MKKKIPEITDIMGYNDNGHCKKFLAGKYWSKTNLKSVVKIILTVFTGKAKIFLNTCRNNSLKEV